jgi:glyoxylase-like metal-dependent hydrolase (beta-lactamase superfamily II)
MIPRFDPVTPDELVEDGAVLDVLGGATVVHVPGHTPGAIALHLPGLAVLFSGDAISHRKGRLGPPPPDFTADPERAVESARRMAQLDIDVLCPGHGPPLVGGAGDRLREMVAGMR